MIKNGGGYGGDYVNRLTLEEFRKLPEKERERRIYELSDHDRFLIRTSEPTWPKRKKDEKDADEEETINEEMQEWIKSIFLKE